jgi:hypothetical protein
MNARIAIATMIAFAFAASPATALFAVGSAPQTASESVDYVVGNGVLVVFQDIEGSGSPGIGGARFLGAVATDLFTVEDMVHGDIPQGDSLAPLAFDVACDAAGCNVFVGAGAVAGTVTWTPQ